jgi:hypothetical protein
MTSLRSCGNADTKAVPRVGGGGTAAAIATACVQAHMPRRRKSSKPWRASGGSGAPSAALRNVSYWTATGMGGAMVRVAAVSTLTAAFFFRPRRARSSWGAR